MRDCLCRDTSLQIIETEIYVLSGIQAGGFVRVHRILLIGDGIITMCDNLRIICLLISGLSSGDLAFLLV